MRLLWSERRFLKKATLYGLALAVLVSFLLPVRYEARTRLMPPDQQSGSGLAMIAALAGRGGSSSSGGMNSALGGSLGGIAGDLLGLKSSGALFVDMLDGATVQDQIIRKFDLRRVYWDKYWEDARKDLAKRTDIKEDRKSGVITIAVSDHDPQRAQNIAQAYVDALNGLVSEVSTSSARRERIFLENRLSTVKQSLDNASQQFSEFASKNGTFDVPEQAKAMVSSEAGLEGQLVAAQSELDGLREIYTDANVRVKTLQARIASLKHQIEEMSGNRANLESDQSNIPGDFPSIRKLPLVGVKWANLYRENKIQETVYELLTQEYELAKMQEAKEIPSVNVLDSPMVPEKKSFPPRTVITIVGTLLAFTLGCVFVIGSAVWRKSESGEKQLATEIWEHLAAQDSRSGRALHAIMAKVGARNGSNGRAA
jgi:capsule polysaccharide export protein KpsE/RkpR